MSGPQFIRPQSTGLSGLGENAGVVPNSSDLNPLDYQVWGKMLESYYKLQPKLKTVYRCTLADLVCLASESH